MAHPPPAHLVDGTIYINAHFTASGSIAFPADLARPQARDAASFSIVSLYTVDLARLTIQKQYLFAEADVLDPKRRVTCILSIMTHDVDRQRDTNRATDPCKDDIALEETLVIIPYIVIGVVVRRRSDDVPRQEVAVGTFQGGDR